MPPPRSSDRHPDLFAPESPQLPMAAAAERRMELLALMSTLLTEALATDAVEASDEDHA